MRREPKTKKHEVARTLEGAILDGRIGLGTRLTELKLASELGVAQSSIREALQELESLGLVVKYPNRGSYVINLLPVDLIHIYQVRTELEPLAWFLAAAQMKQETMDELQSYMDGMRTAAQKRDYRTYSSLDYRFHCLIWESQNNPYLAKTLKALCPPLFAHELVHLYSSTNLGLNRAVRQHERLLAILHVGDPSLVLKVVRRMMRKFLRQDLTSVAADHLNPEEPKPFEAETPLVVQPVGTTEKTDRET
jgi:DNA-binding GntR family transcriptional regulator